MKRLLSSFIALTVLLGALMAFPAPARASTADFFEDAVFLGDSLTVGLEKYVNNKRKSDSGYFSNAQFLARVSYAIAHTLKEDGYSMHPEYDGRLSQPQKSLKAMGAKKVFITLGVNDIGATESTIASNYKKLIAAIKEELPNAQLYMLAVFPMTERKESSSRSNKVIDSLNWTLLKLAMSEDMTFIDFTCALKNDDNALNKEYSSDDYVHLNNDGYAVWTKQMYAFADFARKTGAASGAATVINVKSFVNARSGPGTNYEKVTTVPKGAEVDVKEKAGDGWYKVEYSGKTLYISGRYLSISIGGLEGKVCNVSQFANLRSGPSTGHSKAGKANKGATVTVSKKYYNPKWYRAVYKGETVYISSNLVKVD